MKATMNRELAEHISLLAAPIYAAVLAPYSAYLASGGELPAEALDALRGSAITQAHALWLQTLETEAP
jgi:hypothetical protein